MAPPSLSSTVVVVDLPSGVSSALADKGVADTDAVGGDDDGGGCGDGEDGRRFWVSFRSSASTSDGRGRLAVCLCLREGEMGDLPSRREPVAGE